MYVDARSKELMRQLCRECGDAGAYVYMQGDEIHVISDYPWLLQHLFDALTASGLNLSQSAFPSGGQKRNFNWRSGGEAPDLFVALDAEDGPSLSLTPSLPAEVVNTRLQAAIDFAEAQERRLRDEALEAERPMIDAARKVRRRQDRSVKDYLSAQIAPFHGYHSVSCEGDPFEEDETIFKVSVHGSQGNVSHPARNRLDRIFGADAVSVNGNEITVRGNPLDLMRVIAREDPAYVRQRRQQRVANSEAIQGRQV